MTLSDFSSEVFQTAENEPERLAGVTEALEQALLTKLNPVIATAIEAIVRELNSLGHNLTPEAIGSGEFTFRDVRPSNSPRLRLAADLVVSVGYGDFSIDE